MSNNRKIEVQEKEDFTYSNLTPMPNDVGGYESGTTFSEKTLKEMWDGILYPYQYPAFTSFSMASQSTTLECGIEVAGGNRTFNWGTSNPSNIEANSIEIEDLTTSTVLGTGLANDGSEILDIGTAITKLTTNSVHQWRIYATNTQSDVFNRTFTVRWYSPFYYGVGDPSLSVSAIQQLTKQVVGKSDKTYTFNPSTQVMYFAYPASYGDLTSILDPNNFEIIGDFTKRQETFTTNSPYYEGDSVLYNVYEFNNLTTQSNFNVTFKF